MHFHVNTWLVLTNYDNRHSKNISALITAFRYHDQVIAVMPYHRNNDFRVR